MNDHDNRIAQLEAEVAALTLRDERREAEHRHLLNAYAELGTSREALRRDTDQTMRLFSDYWDSRISELVKRVSTGDGGEVLMTLLPELVKDTVEYVNRSLGQQESRIMTWSANRADQMLTIITNLLARIEALERSRSIARCGE